MLAIVPAPPANATSRQSDRAAAAAKIAGDLAALEASLDESIGLAAALVRSMLDARCDTGVPVHTGQAALIRLQRAQSQLVAASSDTFRVHDELANLAKTLMIMDDPTNPSGLLADDEPLAAVA